VESNRENAVVAYPQQSYLSDRRFNGRFDTLSQIRKLLAKSVLSPMV
jgi:hypothetical protein